MKSQKTVCDADPAAVGAAIRELRRRAHLSQGDLACRLGMRQGPVCNLEHGKNFPSAQVLLRLAQILNTTTDRILRPQAYAVSAAPEVEARPAPAFQPRRPVIHNSVNPSLYLTSSTVRLLPGDRLTHSVESVVRDYLALEDICRVPRQARIPLQFAFDSSPAGIARAAHQVRTVLGIGDAVVFDPLELFENHGMRVVFMPLPDDVTGFSCYDAMNGNVFIFVGSGLNPERQLFALVHGLARILLYNRSLLLGESPLAQEARRHKAARLFAAAFLMPDAAVRNSVQQIGARPEEWDFELLLRLKHRFGVSAETFNYRLFELDLITAKRQSTLRAQIKTHYETYSFAEPGLSRRILSPNGRLGDLLHTALRRGDPEATAIAERFKKLKVAVTR